MAGSPGTSGEFYQKRSIVQVANGNWYSIMAQPTQGHIKYWKSTDRGNTWQPGVDIDIGGGMLAVAIWYDRWTPGDSGDTIHVVYMESSNNDLNYRSLDTSTDTVGSEVQIFNGASLTGTTNMALTLTKTKAGHLYVVFDGDAGTETGHYVSAASPWTTWTSKTDANEATSDYYFALPGNYADTDDYDLYYLDRSADEWSRKTYDASGNSWSEAVLVASAGFVESTTVYPQTNGCQSTTDSLQYAFGWNCYDGATCDLQGFKFDGTTSTALTNVVTNADDAGMVSCTFDEATSTLYAFYGGKSDGSETIGTSIGIYYKTSTDDGATWSSEQTLNTGGLDDYRYLSSPPTVSSVNVVPPVLWFNDDTIENTTSAENYSNVVGMVS